MSVCSDILAKSDGTPLIKHLQDVANVACLIAHNVGLDEKIARKGALLHDIGKASPFFQKTLNKEHASKPGECFRHEIASLFFISLVDKIEKQAVIEMIAAHHKSIKKDINKFGFLDLDNDSYSFENHIRYFEEWEPKALAILSELGIKTHKISLSEARANYEYAVDICKGLGRGYSLWKGILMAADHFSSALNSEAEKNTSKLFIKPDLSFYNRANDLYPLSLISADDKRKHTIVTAPTGAGKTDFLLRRCSGRVFYTLPFQASINAMYDRIKQDLANTNAQVHLLHAASRIKVINQGKEEESILQKYIGASVKVLTPHQIASIVFGIKGYEAMIADLKNCDVILDEIHTYSETMQSIVLRIVEILVNIGCSVHIGTATMPKVLYSEILKLLGGKENVYEVKLPPEVSGSFNRHIVHKIDNFTSCLEFVDKSVDCKAILKKTIEEDKKILIICNQVKKAQETYKKIELLYPNVNKMLLHSRFRRGDRNKLETDLKQKFNNMPQACIVVSTQVVEVSLDISFDLMITECAPIDALIQRFGRINRVRNKNTIGKHKDVYVLKPSEDKAEILPYKYDILASSYVVLPDNALMQENSVQTMLDKVYSNIEFTSIDWSGVMFENGKWLIKKLVHHAKSALLSLLDINSAVCITESDKDRYKTADFVERSSMEIPVSFKQIGYANLFVLENTPSRPFVIPDKAYSKEYGFISKFANTNSYNSYECL